MAITNTPFNLNNWLSQPITENLSEDDETDFLLDEFFENFNMENIKPNEDQKLLEMIMM